MTKKVIIAIRSWVGDNMIYAFLGLVLIIAAVISPRFFQTRNIFNVLRQASALGILSIGQFIVVIAGGIDLSVAATMQLAGVTIAEVTKGTNALVATIVPAVLLLGALIGLGNGLLVTKRKVEPFISTLFVGLLVTGLRLLVTHATPSGILPPAIRSFGQGGIGSVPNIVILFGFVALLAHFILTRTTLGRYIYAVGGNPNVARLSGVQVDRVVISSYILCGFLAALAGLVLVAYLGYADQEIGTGYDLDSIAAVAVGGAVLGGGKGRISGAIAGVLLMAVLLNIVLLLNLRVEYQLVLRGLVILGAVASYSTHWGGKILLHCRLTRCMEPLRKSKATRQKGKGGETLGD